MDDDFNDPQLAAAVRRCWAAERAPTDLRDRVAALLAEARPVPPVWRRLAWPVAMAASVGLAAGGLRAFYTGVGPVPAAGPAVAVLPAALESELVQTHDHCCRDPNHQHLPVAPANDAGIAAAFRSRLARPVLVDRPADAAWRFAGAAVCPVGDFSSGHLVFHQADGDALSIFSLPRSSAPAAVDGQQFQGEADGHPIVGFVGRGAVFCLVGSGPGAGPSVARLAGIRRQMEADMASAAELPGGELIHGTGR